MKKFEVRKNHIEISFKNRSRIKSGCTFDAQDQYPEIMEIFNDKEAALEALKKYKSEIQKLSGGAGSYYLVTEFYVEENVYDYDGEWISGGDVLKFSEMPVLED